MGFSSRVMIAPLILALCLQLLNPRRQVFYNFNKLNYKPFILSNLIRLQISSWSTLSLHDNILHPIASLTFTALFLSLSDRKDMTFDFKEGFNLMHTYVCTGSSSWLERNDNDKPDAKLIKWVGHLR